MNKGTQCTGIPFIRVREYIHDGGTDASPLCPCPCPSGGRTNACTSRLAVGEMYGPVRMSYNLYFSTCFFSSNSIFLSQQISK